MSGDTETVFLVGGPADGDFITFDGGDWWEFEEAPPATLSNATPTIRELAIKQHTYKRDRRLETTSGYPVFVYQGVR